MDKIENSIKNCTKIAQKLKKRQNRKNEQDLEIGKIENWTEKRTKIENRIKIENRTKIESRKKNENRTKIERRTKMKIGQKLKTG